MSSLQLPSVAPSKDIRHFFPNLDPEQLAAKQDKDALQQQRDAAADVKWRAARAAAAVAAAAAAAADPWPPPRRPMASTPGYSERQEGQESPLGGGHEQGPTRASPPQQ